MFPINIILSHWLHFGSMMANLQLIKVEVKVSARLCYKKYLSSMYLISYQINLSTPYLLCFASCSPIIMNLKRIFLSPYFCSRPFAAWNFGLSPLILVYITWVPVSSSLHINIALLAPLSRTCSFLWYSPLNSSTTSSRVYIGTQLGPGSEVFS